jgi:hypothetical protein
LARSLASERNAGGATSAIGVGSKSGFVASPDAVL